MYEYQRRNDRVKIEAPLNSTVVIRSRRKFNDKTAAFLFFKFLIGLLLLGFIIYFVIDYAALRRGNKLISYIA